MEKKQQQPSVQIAVEEPPFVKKWSEKDLSILIEDMLALKKASSESTKDPKEKAIKIKEEAVEIYKDMKEFFTDYGAEFFEDANEIYKNYTAITEPLVIRREDPIKVAELVAGEPINFEFDPTVVFDRGDKYANCALWPHGPVNATKGIENAFLEGRGNIGPIVALTAFRNNPDHMTITEPEDKMEQVGTLTRQSVKIVSGTVTPQDLEFIIVRVSAKYFPHDKMTEREQKQMDIGKLEQVFRGFKFKK